MALSTTTPYAEQDGDGTTTAFTFAYKWISSADFKVYLYDEDDDEATLQTLSTHYTVATTGAATNGVYPGATITFVTAPGADKKVRILRDPALTQEFDFDAESDPLPVLTREADLNAMRLQALLNKLQRSLRVSDGIPGFSGEVADYGDAAAGDFLALNADKSGFIFSRTANSVTASSVVSTLLTQSTIQAFRRAANAGPWFHIFDYITDSTIRAAILDFSQTGDLSTYIQAACDAADDVGGSIFFPPGRYPILSTITTEGVSFVGDQYVEDLYPYGSKGTVFVFTSTSNTPFKLGESVAFRNIVFYWPNQIDDRATWVAQTNAPIAYPALIENTNTTTTLSGLAFIDCVVLNAYDFIDVGGNTAFDKGGRWTFDGNRICALRRTFNLNNIPDVIACSANNIWGWNVYADEMSHFSGGGAGATVSVSSITRSGTTATVTTASAHGLTTGQKATIAGANESDYNGQYVVTVTGASTFTYTVAGSPSTPATGTITSTAFYLRDYVTDNSVFLRVTGDAAVGARSTYSVDGFIAGGLHWGFRRVFDIDGGTLNILSTKNALFDGVQQILHTRNYGVIAAAEIDMGGAAFCYKFNYTETATPAAFLIDTPAPVSGAAGVTLRIRGNMSYCAGTFLSATGDYVKVLDIDASVDAFAHQITTAGTYYVADINCSAVRGSLRGFYEASAASSGGVNRTGVRLADATNFDIVAAHFGLCDKPIDITDTAGAYLVAGCSSRTTGSTYSLNNASSNLVAVGNRFDKPNAAAELFNAGILTKGSTTGVGYATGAGGAVTQLTDKSTTVELNKVCGAITTTNATLNAGVEVSFTLTNSTIAATDVVTACIKSGATAGAYALSVDAVAAGSCRITITNQSGSNLGEALVINFAVIKAVAA